jgi:hypothetical protein
MPVLRSITRPAVLLLTAAFIVAAAWLVLPARGQGAQTVRLVVDYGDGVTKTINELPFAKGNTVFDAMTAAASRQHGLSFTYTGSGATAVMTKIDDVQNEGAGAAKKNWQYWVNATYGDSSFATFQLHDQDVILWRFTTEQGK